MTAFLCAEEKTKSHDMTAPKTVAIKKFKNKSPHVVAGHKFRIKVAMTSMRVKLNKFIIIRL